MASSPVSAGGRSSSANLGLEPDALAIAPPLSRVHRTPLYRPDKTAGVAAGRSSCTEERIRSAHRALLRHRPRVAQPQQVVQLADAEALGFVLDLLDDSRLVGGLLDVAEDADRGREVWRQE